MRTKKNNMSGIKRLFIGLSAIWLVISLLIALAVGTDNYDGFSFVGFLVVFILVSFPIWLSWLIYWIASGYKKL